MLIDKRYIVKRGENIDVVLGKLNKLPNEKILFVIDSKDKLFGSISDGDIRRALLNKKSINLKVEDVCQKKPKFLTEKKINFQKMISFKKEGIKVIPVLDDKSVIKRIINFNILKSYIPVDAVIMAGGRGKRLSPITDKTPKSMLPLGDKPIMRHYVDKLKNYGIGNFWFCINYLGEQIQEYVKDGEGKINFNYINEKKSLGTIGAVSQIKNFCNDHILISNSDLLTNLNFEEFYLDFLNNGNDMSVVTIPYEVKIPYGILECNKNKIKNIVEKPSYTYFSNAGIYLIKKQLLNQIKAETFLNATDLIKILIENGNNVSSYPFNGYWLDIGNPQDYKKAKNDFKNKIIR